VKESGALDPRDVLSNSEFKPEIVKTRYPNARRAVRPQPSAYPPQPVGTFQGLVHPPELAHYALPPLPAPSSSLTRSHKRPQEAFSNPPVARDTSRRSRVTILRALRAIPRETKVVYHPGVEVYEDSKGQRVREGVQAIILETKSPGGATKTRRVFATTKTHFE
jgi:hypothetical protein